MPREPQTNGSVSKIIVGPLQRASTRPHRVIVDAERLRQFEALAESLKWEFRDSEENWVNANRRFFDAGHLLEGRPSDAMVAA